MAEKKLSANTLVCESQEALYKRAVKKMKADRLIVQHAFKIENYQTAAAMFDEVGAYLDSKELAAKCRKLAEETKAEQKKSQYQKALDIKGKAVTGSDYEKAAALFEELGDYENANQQIEECQKKIKEYNRQIKKKWAVIGGSVVVIAGLVTAGFVTGFFKYSMGVFYDSMGYYKKAEETFSGLELLDSQKRALDCREKVLKQQEAAELKALKKAEAGDSVVFASEQWKVLEREENQIYMILEDIDQKSDFYQVSYDETGATSVWEEASLFNWLNTAIFETAFPEEEKEAMIAADDASEEAFISILSIEQTEKYKEILDDLMGTDYWLRDQGKQDNMAVFVSAAGEVMEYGYPVEAKMSVRPVIMVDCSKLTEEEEA